MSEKPATERPRNTDHVDQKEPKLNVEVVEDLDLPQDDAEAVRGGRCTIVALNSLPTVGGY